MSRIIRCDRCQKDITTSGVGYIAWNWRDVQSDDLVDGNPFEQFDFCEECMKQVKDFVVHPDFFFRFRDTEDVKEDPAPVAQNVEHHEQDHDHDVQETDHAITDAQVQQLIASQKFEEEQEDVEVTEEDAIAILNCTYKKHPTQPQTDRNNKIVEMYKNGTPIVDIAKEFGISDKRVYQIVKRGVK